MPDGKILHTTAPNPWWDKPIHTSKTIRVVTVGAGASGLIFAYKLQRSFEDFELVLYEKNDDVGGTWLENKYPGFTTAPFLPIHYSSHVCFPSCACDIAAHAYTLSFEPNPYWSSTYAGTDEIHQYFLRFTEKYDLRKYCQFNKRVSRAEWDNVKGQWNIQVTDLKTGNIIHDWCHFFINAQGVLNNWKWPDIPGIDKFEGKLMHTATYDRNFDLTDKTVALLGTG